MWTKKGSIAGRPESHGIIERSHQDIILCALIGKYIHSKRTIHPYQKHWAWALPYALAAINASPSRALSKGIVGCSPCEVFKGMEAHLPIDTLLKENTGVVINTTADMEERFQCVKETQERAQAFIQEARTKYEKASDNDLRNRYKQLRSFRTGGLVLRKTKDESVERKSKPTYEVKPYVVVATGERGNYAIQVQRKVNSRCHCGHIGNMWTI